MLTDKTCMNCGTSGCDHKDAMRCSNGRCLWTPIEAEVRMEAQEPVAWKWRRHRLTKWEMVANWDEVEEMAALEMDQRGWEVVRLYTTQQPPAPCPICADKDWYGIDALQAKVAELEQAIMKYQAVATPSERLVLRLRSKVTDQCAEIERLRDYVGDGLLRSDYRNAQEMRIKINAQAKRIAELEAELVAQKEWAECYKAQSKAEMSEQAALIEKCEKALRSAVEWGEPMKDAPRSSRPFWFGESNSAIAAIAAHKIK